MIFNCLDKDPLVRPTTVRVVAYTIAPESVAQPLFITPPPTNVERTAGVATAQLPRSRFSREFYIVMVVLGALLAIALGTLILTVRNS